MSNQSNSLSNAEVSVIGAGLAGCEASNFLANAGVKVKLYEMKPVRFSPAHSHNGFAELVCSNSLKSMLPDTASGALKAEMRLLGSLILESAEQSSVPAGGALAVDRVQFSNYITNKITSNKNITVITKEVEDIPDGLVILATGPLTDGKLYNQLLSYTGNSLHFYDAASPIVSGSSIDFGSAFCQGRYNKGGDDYVNCPLNREEYYSFVQELVSAERAMVSAEDVKVFESCMPIELMAQRGVDTLRFGPFKPVGLTDNQGKRPFAVLQLRKENTENTLYNLVGCQTNLRFAEQERVFKMIPALRNAEFVKFGVMHRNSYVNAPLALDEFLRLKTLQRVFVGGQLCGVEGYAESALTGLVGGINALKTLCNKPLVKFSPLTITGSLLNYLQISTSNFQPMNANFGILPPLENPPKDKSLRKRMYAERAIEAMKQDVLAIKARH